MGEIYFNNAMDWEDDRMDVDPNDDKKIFFDWLKDNGFSPVSLVTQAASAQGLFVRLMGDDIMNLAPWSLERFVQQYISVWARPQDIFLRNVQFLTKLGGFLEDFKMQKKRLTGSPRRRWVKTLRLIQPIFPLMQQHYDEWAADDVNILDAFSFTPEFYGRAAKALENFPEVNSLQFQLAGVVPGGIPYMACLLRSILLTLRYAHNDFFLKDHDEVPPFF